MMAGNKQVTHPVVDGAIPTDPTKNSGILKETHGHNGFIRWAYRDGLVCQF